MRVIATITALSLPLLLVNPKAVRSQTLPASGQAQAGQVTISGGTIKVSNGGSMSIKGNVVNNGSIDNDNGSVNISGNVTNNPNGVLNTTGNTGVTNVGANLNNEGKVSTATNATLNVHGNVTGTGTITGAVCSPQTPCNTSSSGASDRAGK